MGGLLAVRTKGLAPQSEGRGPQQEGRRDSQSSRESLLFGGDENNKRVVRKETGDKDRK